MDELPPPPAGISEEDWHATPPAVQALVVLLLQRLQGVEARLNQTSRNSSKPPSSDPPSAPPRPPKVPRGRQAGGQPGHPGSTREPPPADQIHETIHVYPTCCPECASELSSSLPDVLPLVTTYVWEIPPVVPHITAYAHHTVGCPTCQTPVWTEQRPMGAPPGAFGPRATALAAVLHGRYRLSDRETADYLATVWQLPISLGSVVATHERMSAALAPVDAAILAEVQQQDHGNADETSWREGGKRCWLWTLTTDKATSYGLFPGRGRSALEVLLGPAWRGVLGCDRWSAYRSQPDERRQLCWAHLTRNLRALAEAEGLDGLWGAQALLHVETLWQLWAQVRAGWLDRVQLREALRPVQESLHHLLVRGTSHPWKRVAGFSRDVLRQWDALWTFVRVDDVEPTNNAAEQALRPAVLWRKGCFGTRSAVGSRFVERMLSVVMTCRQQQRNVFAFLISALQAAWAGLPAPDIFAPA
jgi:transposase